MAHSWRDAYGADVVVLAGRRWSTDDRTANQPSGVCGRAFQMNAGETSTAFAPKAFAVVDVAAGCGQTLAHEVGHILSLRHEWGNPEGGDNNGSPFTYNHGYRDDAGGFSTLMAYGSALCGNQLGGGCEALPMWSNPYVTWKDRPVGVNTDRPNPAFNALALKTTGEIGDDFRSRSNPIGTYDREQRWPGGVRVYGWALDYDNPDPQGSIVVKVFSNGVLKATGGASGYRGDVGAAYPGFGPNHGFEVGVPLAGGATYRLCVRGVNVGPGADADVGCRNVFVTSAPFGSLDTATQNPAGVRLYGWAIDPEVADPIAVHMYVDGQMKAGVTASLSRPDVSAANPGYGDAHGFNVTIGGLTAGWHQFCAWPINVGVDAGINTALPCRSVNVRHNPIGNIDSVSTTGVATQVRGWAFDWDTTSPITVKVTVNGVPQADQTADKSRPDVSSITEYQDYGPNHGFDFAAVALSGQQICVTAVNVGAGTNTDLGCRTA